MVSVQPLCLSRSSAHHQCPNTFYQCHARLAGVTVHPCCLLVAHASTAAAVRGICHLSRMPMGDQKGRAPEHRPGQRGGGTVTHSSDRPLLAGCCYLLHSNSALCPSYVRQACYPVALPLPAFCQGCSSAHADQIECCGSQLTAPMQKIVCRALRQTQGTRPCCQGYRCLRITNCAPVLGVSLSAD